jgi:hypothetical protein
VGKKGKRGAKERDEDRKKGIETRQKEKVSESEKGSKEGTENERDRQNCRRGVLNP